MPSDTGPLPESYLEAGIACTDLVADPTSWINRRVETIELLSHEETRRRVSVDFTLTDHLIKALAIDDGVVVPISALTKEARRNFDLRDEGGAAVPVLGKVQNGELAHIALMNAVLDALHGEVSADIFEMLSAELRRVVFDPPGDAADALGHFIASGEAGDRWRSAVWASEQCRSLLDTLWVNYVLFAVLPSGTANRRVLKYSYGDDFDLASDDVPLLQRLKPSEVLYRWWRPDRGRAIIACPGAWRAASFHVEIAIPEELRLETAFLYDRDASELLSAVDLNVNRAALYAIEPLHEDRDTIAYVEVAPERAGRTFVSGATSLVVSTLLWVGVASGLDAKNPGAAVSLLLAGAAVFSSLVAVQGQHRIVQRAFAGSRRWLAVVASSALTASAALAMEIPRQHPVNTWRVCAIVATIAAARLFWSAVRAPS
jgi:hypothetical protein